MPPALPNDQELNLKKRARRRLVGAVALVLLMVIVLPMILQDRAALAPQDAIKITMPEISKAVVDAATVSPTEAAQVPEVSVVKDELLNANDASIAMVDDKKVSNVKNEAEPKSVESKKSVVKPEKQAEEKLRDSPVEAKVQQKVDSSFAIQIGVYSDAANVKQLQAKLKEAGYMSRTEKISTSKGEKIRLRAGNYSSRQDAADALTKLKDVGLSGMVISNE